jgi:nucleolar protein 12
LSTIQTQLPVPAFRGFFFSEQQKVAARYPSYLFVCQNKNSKRELQINMSLLGSIFGGDSKEEKGNLSNLFQKTSDLPDRPHHKPISKPPAKRKSAKEDDEPIKKKRKKERKKPKEDEDTTEKEETDDKEEGSSNEKEQEETDEDRTIFVGNLPLLKTSRKSLASLFKDCGPVASARIRSVPVKGVKLPAERAGDQNLMKKVSANTNQVDDNMKSTVSGYVVFKNIESAKKALEKNNMKVGGLHIRVDKASPTVDPGRSVFCGNLPYGAEESSLQNHFVKACALDVGDVLGVRIIRDKETFQCKGFGYVLFREKSTIPTALKLHNSTYMKKQIRVLVCGKRFKNKKGERHEPKYKTKEEKEKVTAGAFRRLLSKQQKEAQEFNKRKRGQKKSADKKPSGLIKRAALDKKVDKRVKKLEKRVSKGMGKTRH